MWRQQSLFVIAIALVIVPSNSEYFFTNRSYNSSTEWSSIRHIQSSGPLVLESNGSLVHVLDSLEPDHPLRLVSTDFPSCVVSLPLAHPLRYPRRATSLGNGKLVIWLLNYRYSRREHESEWRFVIVEPRTCSQQSFEVRDSDLLPIDVVDVIGYHDSFDLVITSLVYAEPRYTYVYRYDDEGRPVSSFNIVAIPDLDPRSLYRPSTIRIHTISKHDWSSGYFYLQLRPGNHSSLLRKLDANFSDAGPSKRLILPSLRVTSSGTYSTNHGNFRVCRHYESINVLRCLLLDSNLSQRAEVRLQGLPKPSHLSLVNLPRGGALLALAARTGLRAGSKHLYLLRLDRNSTASEAVFFGKVDCDIYRLDSFDVGAGGYCIAVSCDEMVYTRCISVV